MTPDDRELVIVARDLLERIYVSGRHEVVAAVRTSSGRIYTGVHVEGSSRRSSVCAEGVALGAALAGCATRGEPFEVASIVSVLRRPTGTLHLIEPCGVCAELITDYAPEARVWAAPTDSDGEVEPMLARELLPMKRRRMW